MYENFGAVVTASSVSFSLFFPDNLVDPHQYARGGSPKITTLKVTGNFQSVGGGTDWDFVNAPALVKQPHTNGWVYTVEIDSLPDGFYEYKYFLTFENGTTRWCSDPCSKYGGFENENSGFVIGGAMIAPVPLANRLPLDQLVIYEMMLDDFTAEYRAGRAPLDAVLDKIDYLVQLGINAIEFMPWTTWPQTDTFSWGYDPIAFFSVEYNYYNDDSTPLVKLRRLSTLINELHKRNIHVIMDGVYSDADTGNDPNFGFAYYWLYQDPGDSPYIGNFGPGGFFSEFDFANNCVDEFIIDVCQYWISQYGVDGIRFDYVLGYYIATDPSQGIGEVILYVDKYAQAAALDNITLTLELLTDNRYDAINDTNQINASGCWFDPLMWETITTVNSGTISSGLMRALNTGKDFSATKNPVVYLENHDHSTLTAACGGRQQWWVTQPAMIALFTAAGAIFLHNGQEFGSAYVLPESGDDRVIPRPLQWAESTDGVGVLLVSLYTLLIKIRKENPVLAGHNFYPDSEDVIAGQFNAQGYGADSARGLVIYHRWGNDADGVLIRYIVALNYSALDNTLTIPFSANGNWTNLLDGSVLQVENYACPGYVLTSHWGAIFRLVG
jgi:pullulanase